MAPSGCMIEVIAMGTRGRQHELTKYKVKQGERKDEWSRKVIEESSEGGIRRVERMENTAG